MSHGGELFLELDDGSSESSRIKSSICSFESGFVFVRNMRMSQESLIRRLRMVVGFGDFASVARLGFELHNGLEEVGEEPERTVELAKDTKLSIVIIAGIADGLSNDGVVFLFHKAAIILAIGSATGKGDFVFATVSEEFRVNELTTVVRVNTFESKGKLMSDIGQGFKDPPLRLGLESIRFCPG